MAEDHREKITDVANGLEDVGVTVDELKYDSTVPARPETIDRLKRALDEATDAADALDNETGHDD